MGQIRLYTPQRLAVGTKVVLSEKQSHYLSNVMKLKVGDELYCFDNQSGEYKGTLAEIGNKQSVLDIVSHNKPYYQSPDIWLLFAPVKKDNTDFILQKATELGVRKIVPVITRYTITDHVKQERFVSQVIEASEQSRRLDIPEIGDVIKFDELLQKWDKNRKLYYMDETLNGEKVSQAFGDEKKCAVLVGPEGGFSKQELEQLRTQPFAKGVCLGPRILRAETAVVSALSCWQALKGDWQ